MPRIIPTILLLICSCASTFDLQAASEFSEGFIAEQLEQAQSNPDHRVVIEVKQPIELVFEALLARLHEYSNDVTGISFDHSMSQEPSMRNVGSVRISTMKDGKSLSQRIILHDTPRAFAYFTDMTQSTVNVPIDYSIGHYRFSEQEDGSTRVQVSVVYKPSSRLTALLVRLGFNRAMDRDFRKAEEYLNSLNSL